MLYARCVVELSTRPAELAGTKFRHVFLEIGFLETYFQTCNPLRTFGKGTAKLNIVIIQKGI